MDADDGGVELDEAVDIRGEGVVVLDVPLEALKLHFAGGFVEDVPGEGNVRRDFGETVDGSLPDAGQHDVDGFEFRGGGGGCGGHERETPEKGEKGRPLSPQVDGYALAAVESSMA